MKSKNPIAKNHNAWLLFLGIMAASVIFAGHSAFYFHPGVSDTGQAAQFDGDSGQDDTPQVAQQINDAIASIAQLNLSHALHHIADIVLPELNNTPLVFGEPIGIPVLLEVLFERISPPNAP